MSYTATARKLYIHRSTLIDRISRIEKELNIDLKDSDQRLQLEILLKAVDLEEVLRQQ
jgi:DNA-binding PucR family transcriptional regulator